MNQSVEELVRFILNADRESARSVLELSSVKYSPETTLTEVLDPALKEIGRLWETEGNISLAQAYVAGKVSEDFLKSIHSSLSVSEDSQKGTVIIGNCEDDFHSLGRKMVGIFLKTAGWNVIDLGNDVPAKEFIDQALKHKASVIGVSAMMYSTALNIRKIRTELDERGLSGKIKLAVGGAVFRLRPELIREVGGDGTAGNAIEAPDLFDRLVQSH